MASSGKIPQGSQDNSLLRSLKPITTKPKQPSSAAPVLPDSPFQPTSQSHVAALASSLMRHGSSDLALDKAAPLTHVLQDSPYQPSSHKHVAQLAGVYAEQAGNNSSAKPSTPQHTPVLADSGGFQPGSRSHVAQLISQVTSRLQEQSNGSSSNSNSNSTSTQHQLPGDLPYQPDSKAHVAELMKTFKQTPSSPAADSSSTRRTAPVHGFTPHNTPLARTAVGTFFTTQQQQGGPAGQGQPTPQDLASSSDPTAAPGALQIIHLSYGKAAPFKGMPGASRVAAVAHQLEQQCTVDNEGTGSASNSSTASSSAACGALPGSGSGACAAHGSNSSHAGVGASPSCVIQSAATPEVSHDGMNVRLLPPSRKPQVVAARLSGITLEGAKVALERTASAEVAVSLASDSGQNMNPLYRPTSEGLDMTGCVGVQE
uniref:Uncharacterized protein n=1 Tax=Tetradesmus obliquus TaxID=3088 RepID=A0A383VES0_TETOB|eukprot:jgi/Sobl393_1/14102/SZX63430.1